MADITAGNEIEVTYTVRMTTRLEVMAEDLQDGRTGEEAVKWALLQEHFPWTKSEVVDIEKMENAA